MKSADDAIAGAWNIQNGEKVYPLHMGTSDVDGIKKALCEAGYDIIPTWRLMVGVFGMFAGGFVTGVAMISSMSGH